MKKTDAQLIISAVGRAVRKLLDPVNTTIADLTAKLATAETTIATQRQTIESLVGEVKTTIAGFAERTKTLEDYLVQLKNNPVKVPTLDEIVANIKMMPPPSVEEIAAVVLRDVMEPVKQIVADAIPTAEDVAKLVPAPVVPTAEEISKLVVVPTAEDVAKLVVVPAVPTAEEIAKHVPLPELPTIELPEMPEVPTLDEIVASVKEILPTLIPAPIKGDTGKSITIDDVRPMIEEFIKSLPKPQDGKSVTIDEVRPLFAQWLIEFERLAVDRHDKLLAQMPRPTNGKDGLGFDHLRALKAEQIEDRVIRFFVMDGETRVDLCEIKLSHPLHKGVFVEGTEYERGDQVTRDGCQWIALKDQPAGMPGASDDWQLAVKKGRDGKDGVLKSPPPTQVKVAPRKGE